MTTPELQQHYPDWEIVKPLGEGSFEQVYEIKRSVFATEQHAALKVIRIPKSRGEVARAQSEGMDETSLSAYFHGFVQSLSDEIALLSRLKGNSNIVSYEDHQIIPNPAGEGVGWTILIRMELLTPLLEHMRTQPLHQREVLQLGLDLCRALALCQREHIIHRDIKPDNIFVSQNGDYKLGDFGVARELEQTAAGLSRKGTFTYMAPEVFNGQAYNSTVDIYSLGVVLYALLNGGRTPFLPPAPQPIKPADREQAQARQLSGEALPPLAGVNPLWDEIIAKACAHEPKQRYQSAGELAEALQGLAAEFESGQTVGLWAGGRAAEAPLVTTERESSVWIDGTPVKTVPEQKPEPEPPVSPKKKKSRVALIASLAAAALVIIGVVAGVLLLNRGPSDEQLDVYTNSAWDLLGTGLYDDCVTYINSVLPQINRRAKSETGKGALCTAYLVQGESYFELEQYQAAVAAYETANACWTDRVNLLVLQRNTAIAYARGGDIDRAESYLKALRALPDSEGSVALLLGEIAFAKGNWEEALAQLQKGIALPGDGYEDYRAYLLCDKALRKLGGREKEDVALLRKALNELSLSQGYMTILNERLADAYSRNKQYKEAVAIFEQLRDGGDNRLATLQNIGQLYQQMKQYDKARAAFEAMRQAYPKRHEGAMRLCYLLLAEQGAKKNEQRDYTEAQSLYAEAQRLYDQRGNASGEDLEMQKLAGVMEELERGGWGTVAVTVATTVPTTVPTTRASVTTIKAATTKSQFIDMGQYYSFNHRWVCNISASKLANLLGCKKSGNNAQFDIVYYGSDDIKLEAEGGRDKVSRVSWSNPNIALYGVKIGDSVSSFNTAMQKHVQIPMYDHPEWNRYEDAAIGCSYQNGKITSFSIDSTVGYRY
jgi:serine/threonine protein kinase/lipopolysaccharide biosynthesis regulator YciM